MTTPRPPSEPPRDSWIPIWVWPVAAALLLLAAFTTWQAQRTARDLSDLERETAQQRQRARSLGAVQQLYQQALNIVAAADSRQIPLRPANRSRPVITVYWSPKLGLALTGDNVPAVAKHRALQLWMVPKEGAPVSVGTFHPTVAAQILLVVPSAPGLDKARALIVTDEPEAGSSYPAAAPLWSGPLG